VSANSSTGDVERAGRTSSATREQKKDEEVHELEESVSVAMSALAGVATAWSAFQAATWNGRQTFALAAANKARQLSSQLRIEGDQQQHLDANLFVSYASAYAIGNEALTRFLYERFPQRLKKAMDAWLAKEPLKSHDAPATPFVMPEYQIEAHQRALALATEGDDLTARAGTANRISDTFVLGTVVFATIVLLASLAPRLHRRRPRRAMLVLSGVALSIALAWLLSRPVAWVG
jgi:hypothetical protein